MKCLSGVLRKQVAMTDKQIIIDGIDVGGCIYYDNGKCLNDEMVQCNCKNVAVCYYKEYKRKEQECEELKEARKNSRCAWKSLEGTFCPEAQEQLEAYKMEADEGKEINAELKAENEEWKKANDCILTTLNVIAEGNKKLRQTLTEIKEIAEELKNFYEELGKCEDLTVVRLKQILQKINECEVEDVPSNSQ